VVAIALIEAYVGYRRGRTARAAERAVAFVTPSAHPPPDAYLHPGHTWVRLHGDDLATVGASAFASSFAGRLTSISLPKEGSRLRQADPACALVADGAEHRRRLDLVMPVDGKVLAVNKRLLDDPGLVQRRPYDEGWLFRIRPRRLGAKLHNLLPAEAARGWLDASRSRVAAQLEPAVGAICNDGGELEPAFGEHLDDAAWNALRRDLFPGSVASAGKGGA
jgi:glycine cleavage system H lipoate-binding protein